jgi:hypothetical protein
MCGRLNLFCVGIVKVICDVALGLGDLQGMLAFFLFSLLDFYFFSFWSLDVKEFSIYEFFVFSLYFGAEYFLYSLLSTILVYQFFLYIYLPFKKKRQTNNVAHKRAQVSLSFAYHHIFKGLNIILTYVFEVLASYFKTKFLVYLFQYFSFEVLLRIGEIWMIWHHAECRHNNYLVSLWSLKENKFHFSPYWYFHQSIRSFSSIFFKNC